MDKSLFDYSDYKAYLEARLGSKSQRKGLKSKVAAALNCQPTYISQVLHGSAHLSLEHADQLNAFLEHDKEGSLFFLYLVQKDRAGTKSLKKHFSDQIDEILKNRMILTNRLGRKTLLSAETQTHYYSSWHFAAIHVALTIEALQAPKELSQFFQLPTRKVISVLEFLCESGLANKVEGGRYTPGSNFIRLGNDSPNIARHHSNWRMHAIESMDREEIGDLHYSAVVSLSKKDALKLKDRLLQEIKENIDLVRASPEEELFCYTVDFFNLRR